MRRRFSNTNKKNYNTNNEYLTFEVVSDSQFNFTNTVQYSIDKINWYTLSANQHTPVFNSGAKVYWRGELTPDLFNGIGTFSSTGQFNVSGNPIYLLKDNKFANFSFRQLFKACLGLIDASELILDSITLTTYCYAYMFQGCTSLTAAPELPATTLKQSCYNSMFKGCTSLTTAPELPATIFYNYCYTSMFQDCTSLTVAPELPATTLADHCYLYMFAGCTSLTQAPELPATTLVDSCYSSMFDGCSSLNYVRSHATNISASNCLNRWLYGVSSTGKFHKSVDVTYPTGASGIPTGWNIYDIKFLTFEVVSDSQFNFTNTVQYSIDKINWVELPANTNTPTFYPGTKVYWKGKLTPKSGSGIGTFSSTGRFNVSGNPKELLKDNELVDYSFYKLFYNCTNLVDASGLILDATTLAKDCYIYMFSGCTSLTTTPELPATTLANHCYYGMFKDCTSLTQAPELPATTLADFCYQYMFEGCTSLTQAPELPATTLEYYCYAYMFSGCKSLTTAPELPATTLGAMCYDSMFEDCTSLTQAPELPATIVVASCYYGMFRNCTSLTVAPELPATTLEIMCYSAMFAGCTKLNYIKSHATNISANRCLEYWLLKASSTGDFYKPAGVTYPTGYNGIPSGWTKHNIEE